MKDRPIAVIGGGAWGTALAVHLARNGHAVQWWLRDDDLLRRVGQRIDNPTYLPGVPIPSAVRAGSEMAALVAGCDLVVAAVPSQFAAGVYRRMRDAIEATTSVLVASKGIEEGSLALPIDVAQRELGRSRQYAVISGPSFAAELARGLPTAVVIASSDAQLARSLQQRIASRELRVYTNRDYLGVQLAGALKNVMAIAVGISDGLGMGTNARAGLITRGLAEMARLIIARGGRAETAAGLAGLGDLVLTCTGSLSRNRRVGERIGRGERLQDILHGARSVAEGVQTTRSTRELAAAAAIEMPIVEEVYRILYEDSPPESALERLMGRPLSTEDEPPGSHDR